MTSGKLVLAGSLICAAGVYLLNTIWTTYPGGCPAGFMEGHCFMIFGVGQGVAVMLAVLGVIVAGMGVR
jgi:hypothetical protein